MLKRTLLTGIPVALLTLQSSGLSAAAPITLPEPPAQQSAPTPEVPPAATPTAEAPAPEPAQEPAPPPPLMGEAPVPPPGMMAAPPPPPPRDAPADMMEKMVQQEEDRMRQMEAWLNRVAEEQAALREQSYAQKGDIEAHYQAMLEQALERQETMAKQHEAMRKRAEERRAEVQAEMDRLRSMSPEELRAYFIEKHHERQLEHRRPQWMGFDRGQAPMEGSGTTMQPPRMGGMPMGQMPMGGQPPAGMSPQGANAPQTQRSAPGQSFPGGYGRQGFPMGRGFAPQGMQQDTPSGMMAPQGGATVPGGYYRDPMGNRGTGYPPRSQGPWANRSAEPGTTGGPAAGMGRR